MPTLRRLIFIAIAFSSCIPLLFSSKAAATYVFAVKIVNNSGDPIKVTSAYVKRKSGTTKECDVRSDQELIQNGSSTVSTNCYVLKRKWQRQIRVRFWCDYQGSDYGQAGALRTLSFPRGGNKFFARDHAVNNGDKYVVKIKASDC